MENKVICCNYLFTGLNGARIVCDHIQMESTFVFCAVRGIKTLNLLHMLMGQCNEMAD